MEWEERTKNRKIHLADDKKQGRSLGRANREEFQCVPAGSSDHLRHSLLIQRL